MRTLSVSAWLLGAVALPLAACNQTTSNAVVITNITPASFRMPEGTGCRGEAARYRAVMDNDLRMGHVNQSVYVRVDKEIAQAESACASGREADSVRMINATKSRYGYR
ncbi:hypothetical protein [Microvirga alba]|uniref:Lipoprotein n=1 Tax=Microvirga alba TaxID=2791025 RepID=A0A931BRX6_9HYPH|nr:hypothetical protein [Microvirga alba]MBF9233538.1 hypothetical protein [Microvirga alba]